MLGKKQTHKIEPQKGTHHIYSNPHYERCPFSGRGEAPGASQVPQLLPLVVEPCYEATNLPVLKGRTGCIEEWDGCFFFFGFFSADVFFCFFFGGGFGLFFFGSSSILYFSNFKITLTFIRIFL